MQDRGSARHGLTHHLFRYPAKFHPPVVRALVEEFSREGDLVLDPFCGSGTALIEAGVQGRLGVGLDIDPLAVAVTAAKTARYDVDKAASAIRRLERRIDSWDRGGGTYDGLKFRDLGPRRYRNELEEVERWVPAIPNLEHWFRRYVIIDLARLRREIDLLRTDTRTRWLLLVVFGSIIRNASNADPVPVSGLEVTSHMRARDAAGRVVDPFSLFKTAVRRALPAVHAWYLALGSNPEPRVFCGDAMRFPEEIPVTVDAVITSPPYHTAVDYYRRHQLEMFWMGLTQTHNDRLELLPHYIGRPRVRKSHPLLEEAIKPGPLALEWVTAMEDVNEQRARDLRHYINAMTLVFRQLSEKTTIGAPVILVVGHSAWNGKEIPTADLLAEAATPHFAFQELMWYPVRNRYMSYARRNGADIDREYVLVLKHTGEQ